MLFANQLDIDFFAEIFAEIFADQELFRVSAILKLHEDLGEGKEVGGERKKLKLKDQHRRERKLGH